MELGTEGRQQGLGRGGGGRGKQQPCRRIITWQLVRAKAAEQSINVGQHRAADLVQVRQLLQVVGYLLLWHHSAQLRFILEEADDKLFPQREGCCPIPNAHSSFLWETAAEW